MKAIKMYVAAAVALTCVWARAALVINEVCYDNSSFADENGDKTSDWIEIYNTGTTATNVYNNAVGDTKVYSEASGVRLPNYFLAPGGFLIIYANSALPEYTAWTNAPNFALISSNSVWRYLAPAAAPAAAWRTNTFNDASWDSGLSPLGYNDSKQNLDCATVLGYGGIPSARYPTAYFRRTFMAYKPWTVTGMVMNARLNDGAVVYLNGREVFRQNMPVGAVAHDTLASASRASTLWTSALLATNGLIQGTNVFAVEVHQAAADSPDLIMDLSLTALVKEQVPIIHGQFGLSKEGENAYLFKPNDPVNYAHKFAAPGYEIGENNSYGLALDGNKSSKLTVFTKPTPGRSNEATATKYQETLTNENLSFSVPPGVYAANQTVALHTVTAGLKVYYTLDGSDPRDSSTFLYSDNGDSLMVSNLASATSGIAWIRTNPVEISNSVPTAAWMPPVGGVSQATVLRAIAVSLNGKECSPEIWGSYLIGSTFTNRTLPVVSLIAYTNDLFGFTNGIYVPGKAYADSPVGYGTNRWGKPYANYHQDSDDNQSWERPVRFELVEPSATTPAVSQLLGVSMHGGGTRAIPEKTLYLMARLSEYGADRVNYKLFPDEAPLSYKRFLLRNSGNDWYGPDTGVATMMKDAVFHRLVKGLDISVMAYRPTVTYLNGQYWGIHNLRESFDKHYLATRYGVDPDNCDILMHEEDSSNPQKVVFTRIDGNKSADDDYAALMGWVSSNSLSVAANFQQVQTQVDVTNLADYVVAETFFANTDWPINNCDFWRTHTNQVATCGQYGDTRWRWMLYDVDVAGEQGGNFDMFDYLSDKDMTDVREPGFLINKLWKNPSYRNYFVTRYANLLNTTFRPERTGALISLAAQAIAPEIETHFRRWGRTFTRDQWQETVNTALIQFAATRHAVLWGHLNKHFELGGTNSLTVRNSDPGGTGGHFVVNGIQIETATDGVTNRACWSGTFFKSLGVTVKAVPDSGYVFVKWEDDVSAGAERTVSVNVTTPQTLVARFLPEGSVGCTVTFDAGSGTVNPTNKYVAVDAAYGTLPTPTRVGYVFDGWWTGPDGAGTQVTEATVVTGFNDRTLYAKWVFATFTVTFDAQGGAVNPASTNVTFGSAYGALPVPVLSGYAFAGWRTGEGGTGQQVTDATTVTVRSDHTLYAAWTANVYTVTFNAHGGRGNPASKSVTFGSAYGTLPLPIRDGYTFAGWWTIECGGGEQITESTVVATASDHTLNANWIAITQGSITRSIDGTRVSLTVIPALGITEWSCREWMPEGLKPLGITGPNARWIGYPQPSITWEGTGASVTTLSYSVRGAAGSYTLSGTASFDGAETTISGDSNVTLEAAVALPGWRYPRADSAGMACASEYTRVPVTATLASKFTLAGVSGTLLTGDVDGDGALELVMTAGSELRLYRGDGSLKRTILLPQPCFPSLLEDADGDGTLDIGLGSGGAAYLYKGDGTLLKTVGQYYQVGTNVTLSPIRLAGPTVLTGFNTANDVTVRGVAAFEDASDKESWSYLVGPSNGNTFSLADMDGDGLLDITMRSATGRSGVNVNGTVDTNMVLVVVDENGAPKLSVKYPAPAGGVADHVFADLDRDGVCEILGFEGHDATANKGTSQIHVFGADGVVRHTFDGPANSGWSYAVGDLAGDAGLEIVATSTTGEKTMLFDRSLNKLLEKVGVGYVKLLCDLTGDGTPEIVTMNDKGLLRVLDNRLNVIASVQAGTRQGQVIASDIDGDGVVELICLTDKVYAFAFRALALPRVNTFSLDLGKASTADRVVTLNNTCSNAPTYYMASESRSFEGAVWLYYATAPSFTLSDGVGDKTVYFKVKNAAGESAAVSDTIGQPLAIPTLTSFAISAGAVGTKGRTVTLDNACTGVPSEYQASTNATFSGASWLQYSLKPTFELPVGKGTKTVYFRVRNSLGVSAAKSDTITLDETAVQVTAVANPVEGGTVTPSSGLLYAGKSLSVTAKATTGWVFTSWENGSLALTRQVTLADDKAGNGLIAVTASFKPLSEIALPAVANPGIQPAMVGVAFSLPLKVMSECLATLTVTGLPAGLTYNAARLSIGGVPTKAGTYPVTLTVSNAKGAAVPQIFTLTVEALPARAQGTFTGVASRGGGKGDDVVKGLLSATVSVQGLFSAKVTAQSGTVSFTGTSWDSASNGVFQATLKTTKGETLTLAQDTSAAWNLVGLTGALTGGTFTAGSEVQGQRNPSVAKTASDYAASTNALARFKGYYTVALPPDGVLETPGAAGNVPLGSGWLALTVKDGGAVALAGKLADGTVLSGASTLIVIAGGDAGEAAYVPFLFPLYSAKGVFSGVLEILQAASAPTGNVVLADGGFIQSWAYPGKAPTAIPAQTEDRFTLSLGTSGGWYNTLADLRAHYSNAVFAADAASVSNTYTSGAYTTTVGIVASELPEQALRFDAKTGAVSLSAGKAPVYDKVASNYVYAVTNPAVATMTATKATGLFSGTFNLYYEYRDQKGALQLKTVSVSHEGALTPTRAEPDREPAGQGFYLVPETWKSPDAKPVAYPLKRSYGVEIREVRESE